MKKVFIIQVPHRKDAATGMWVPMFNINAASEFGEVVVVIPNTISIFQMSEVVKYLRNELSGYNFERGDSIVPCGDPTIIAASGSIIAERNKRYKLLKWDKNISRYTPLEVNLI